MEKKEKKIIVTTLKVLCVNILTSALLLVVMAFLAYQFHFDDTKIRVSTYCIYGITNMISGILIGKLMEEKKYLWGGLSGFLYFVVLVVVSAFIGGVTLGSVKTWIAVLLSVFCGMLGGIFA